ETAERWFARSVVLFEPTSVSGGDDSSHARQLRLRLLARTCPVGFARSRVPLRDRRQFRRYFLQQLFSKRYSTRRPGGPARSNDDEGRHLPAGISSDRGPRRADRRDARGHHLSLLDRSLQERLPLSRSVFHRPQLAT